MAMQKTVIDHLLAKGIAVLMVDPFTPRNEPEGICANLNGGTFVKYATRGGNDVAALKLLKATLGVDPNRTFLQGHSWGRYRRSSPWTRTLRRCTTPRSPDSSYYPYCWDNVQSSAPTLVLIGEQDDWTPAALCQAVKNKPNFEIVVFPDSYHAFVSPMGKPVDYLGHHIAYNENAALEAQQRADAFLDAHLK